MPGFDDKLTRELERAARPAAPDVVRTFEDVTRRRAHRVVVRKVQVVAVVAGLLAGTAGAFLLLDDRFDGRQPLTPVDTGGTITFTWVDRNAIAGVWAVAGDGSNARELFPASLPDGTWVQNVVASPDGSRVAYVASQTDGDGPGGIVVANADGTDPRIVGANISSSQLAWSPDGSTIAALEGGPRSHVVLIATTGSDPQRLGATAGATSFDWAPDGRSLYVATVEGVRSTIRVVPLDDAGDGRSFEVGGTVKALAVSPGDGTIAYVADVMVPTFGSPGDVWLLDPATGDTTRLTTDAVATDVAWSPDGSRIALSTDGCAVMTMSADGDEGDAVRFRDEAAGCPLDVAWGPGLPTTFTPTPLSEDGATGLEAWHFQERPVLAIVDLGAPDSPELTCEPSACTSRDLAPDESVTLVDADGQAILRLGPAVIDAGNIVITEAVGLGGDPPAEWVVTYGLDAEGTAAFAEASRAAAGAEPPRNQIAIVLDGAVISVPVVQEPITSGQGQISSGFSQEEATALAERLGAGTTGPTVSPAPSLEPGPEGEDIGLGTNWCDVQRLEGLDLLGDGTGSTVWTGYPVNAEGRCPRTRQHQAAVDVTGDGLPDATTDVPLVNCEYLGCFPLGGTDLNADGVQEIVVIAVGAVINHAYLALRIGGDEVTIEPILVAEPGNPDAEINPGHPLNTSAAGDEGFAGWIRCEGYPDDPVLVSTWSSTIVDSDEPTDWHETKLELRDDGMFHVVAATNLQLPQDEDPGFLRSEEPACGLDFRY